MPTYASEAVTGAGKKSRGREEASSTGALQQLLESRGLFVLNIAEATDDDGERKFRFGRKREVLEATSALATLLPVGMLLSQALNAATGRDIGRCESGAHRCAHARRAWRHTLHITRASSEFVSAHLHRVGARR